MTNYYDQLHAICQDYTREKARVEKEAAARSDRIARLQISAPIETEPGEPDLGLVVVNGTGLVETIDLDPDVVSKTDEDYTSERIIDTLNRATQQLQK